jgi:KUP system potassium uptake protein
MFTTTTLIAVSIPVTKHLPWVLGLGFLLIFGFFDGLFWGAALRKVPLGAWFPLGLGGILWIIMVFWSWAHNLEDKFDNANSQRLDKVLINRREYIPQSPIPRNSVQLREEIDIQAATNEYQFQDVAISEDVFLDGLTKLDRIPVMTFFHRNDSEGKGIPHTFSSFLHRYPALPQVVIFLTTKITGVPHIDIEDRYVVNKVRTLPGCYAITMRTGYLDRASPEVEHLLPLLVQLEARIDPTTSSERIKMLEEAAKTVTHILPSYTIVSSKQRWRAVSWIRRILIEEVYARARVMFPERHGAPDPKREDTIEVAVTAVL